VEVSKTKIDFGGASTGDAKIVSRQTSTLSNFEQLRIKLVAFANNELCLT